MVRRIAVAALWFVSAWMNYAVLAYFLGLPDGGGLIVGVLVSTFVLMDPTGQLWANSERPATQTASPQVTSQSDAGAALTGNREPV